MRKQINIFYRSGRPIFNITKDTEHLRFHRSPAYAKDVNVRIPPSEKTISNIQWAIPMKNTEICDLLNIKYPIIQGGMVCSQ